MCFYDLVSIIFFAIVVDMDTFQSLSKFVNIFREIGFEKKKINIKSLNFNLSITFIIPMLKYMKMLKHQVVNI